MKKNFSYFIYWLIQSTWGVITTFFGAIVSLVFILFGQKPKTFGPNIYFEIGKDWGGFNLGPFFFCEKDTPLSIKKHECGHGIQNLYFGPIFPFLILIPSYLRYWLRNRKAYIKKLLFSLNVLVFGVLVFTLFAWLMTFTGIKGLVIAMEVLRIYFVLISIWLTAIEIPKYIIRTETEVKDINVDYDEVWFEKQATNYGNKIYQEKKEG